MEEQKNTHTCSNIPNTNNRRWLDASVSVSEYVCRKCCSKPKARGLSILESVIKNTSFDTSLLLSDAGIACASSKGCSPCLHGEHHVFSDAPTLPKATAGGQCHRRGPKPKTTAGGLQHRHAPFLLANRMHQ